MKRKLMVCSLVLFGLFSVTGCDALKNNNKDDQSNKNTTTQTSNVQTNTKVDDTTKASENTLTVEAATEVLRNFFNNGEEINFNYLDTVTVTENNVSKKYYKIDVRHHNGAGTNSRLDIYYIIADKDVANKNGNGIYDSAAFKNKFNVE